MTNEDRPHETLTPIKDQDATAGSFAERTLTSIGDREGGAPPDAGVPPAGEVWFGTSFDPTTMAIDGRVRTVEHSGSVAAVAHLTRPSSAVNLMIAGAGMTVLGAYGRSEGEAELFGWTLTGGQFYSAGPYRVTIVDAGNNVLAAGAIQITDEQADSDATLSDDDRWNQLSTYLDEASRLSEMGREVEALELLDQALDELPAATVALLDARVGLLGSLRRWPEALSDSDKALALTPSGEDRAALLVNRAWIQCHLGQGAEALAASDEALALAGQDPVFQSRILLNRAYALSTLGRYRDALAASLRGLELAPDDPDLWYDSACYHAKLNELDDSISALETSIDLDPERQRDKARLDKDFDALRMDSVRRQRFQAMVD